MSCFRNPVLAATFLASVALAAAPTSTLADGYVYVPRSFYVAPPVVTSYYPVLYPPPIVVYEPRPPAQPLYVGTYYALPAPGSMPVPVVQASPLVQGAPGPVRIRESWNSHPWRSRYRYEEKYPNGLEHKYRYKRDGGYVRVEEKWDD